jgi:sulfite exporter TauE/SafE
MEKRRPWLLAAYNLGRLITYVALGIIVGAIGSMLDAAATLAGLGRAAAVFAGLFMILFGGVTLARLAGWKTTKLTPPAFLQNLLGKGLSKAAGLPPAVYAIATGMLTTLIPCGWLYAFVTVAGGTANPLTGGLVMAIFWLGTLPVLLTIGLTLNKLSGAFAKKLPVITAMMIVIMGMYTILSRWDVSALAASRAIAADDKPLIDQAKAAGESVPECCKPKEGANK